MIRLLLREQRGDKLFGGGWLLRVPVQAGTSRVLRQAHVFKNGAWLIAAHIGEYLLWLLSWAVLGRSSFEGHMDRGWLWLWATLLFTLVPFRIFSTFTQGMLAIGTGAMLKRRLLLGALRLEPEEIRHGGTGSFLGQAFEAEAVESLTLSGGVAGVLSCIEIAVAACLLGRLSILLLGWCVLVALVGRRFLQHYQHWTGTRLEMTQDLVENMVGHRTRLAQGKRSEWHRQEDEALNGYLQRSQEIDFGGTWLVAFLPRGWLLAGLLFLAPLAMSPVSSRSDLAIKLGGVLLAFTAFKKLTASSVDIAATLVAGKRILPLFRAAQRPSPAGHLPPEAAQQTVQNVIEADRVTFRYRPGGAAALHPSSLMIRRGERVLLEGGSGGGKTTFASLLSGMRQPESGLLLLNGLDRHIVGAQRWRQQVASAPQFHENHILTETLAFNLLMGRRWPPTQSDVEEAESLCYRLGLGELLERMPGGIMQMVGEGGWQLSHGERSRVYIARALLQKAELVILDESFAALDPENLRTALQCTLEQAETLMVIAHP
jgi:ATP-binding cassette subfamily B protein